jgi:hypothetical protein
VKRDLFLWHTCNGLKVNEIKGSYYMRPAIIFGGLDRPGIKSSRLVIKVLLAVGKKGGKIGQNFYAFGTVFDLGCFASKAIPYRI